MLEVTRIDHRIIGDGLSKKTKAGVVAGWFGLSVLVNRIDDAVFIEWAEANPILNLTCFVAYIAASIAAYACLYDLVLDALTSFKSTMTWKSVFTFGNGEKKSSPLAI